MASYVCMYVCAYFVNSNTQLTSDLADNQFYPSAERICLCIRLNNAGKWACNRLTEDADFSKKKSSFQMKIILILAGMQTSRIVAFGAQKTRKKSPWSSGQYVRLLDKKPEFEFQARRQIEIRNVVLRRFPLSRFLAKTLRENKICHEKFLKQFVVRSRL